MMCSDGLAIDVFQLQDVDSRLRFLALFLDLIDDFQRAYDVAFGTFDDHQVPSLR